MAAIGIQHLALGIALAVTSAGCSSWRPPVVVKVARTINNAETISSKDYERLREVTEEAIDHIKGVDPHIRPQLTLSSQKNFVDEIADQTRSGFGPDLLITDSDTALEEVARQHQKVLQYQSPQAFTVDFADSSINYKLLFCVRNPLEAFSVGSDLRQAIWMAFDKKGIGIPFPQRQTETDSDPANGSAGETP